MNESFKKLSDETKELLISSLNEKSFVDLISKTKSAGDTDSGTFSVIISTADVDRQGESVTQLGWDLTFYKMNPIVLWAHDYKLLPIGVATSVEMKDGKLVAEGKFAPAEANPFAQQVRKLYDLGYVNTTSVGFIPKEYDGQKSSVITKAELLEFSFVPVPANPYALRRSQIVQLGIDRDLLKVKGIEITEQVEEAKIEEKGQVEDKLEAMKSQKWMKYRPVYDTLDALACCYFDESTPADDFAKLVNEAAEILKTIAGSPEADVKEAITKLAGKSQPLIIVRSHIALGSLVQAEGDKNSKEIEAVQRSKSSQALKEVNKFVETRELARSIDNLVGKVLENFNSAARTR